MQPYLSKLWILCFSKWEGKQQRIGRINYNNKKRIPGIYLCYCEQNFVNLMNLKKNRRTKSGKVSSRFRITHEHAKELTCKVGPLLLVPLLCYAPLNNPMASPPSLPFDIETKFVIIIMKPLIEHL